MKQYPRASKTSFIPSQSLVRLPGFKRPALPIGLIPLDCRWRTQQGISCLALLQF